MNRLTCPSLACINTAVPSAGAAETGIGIERFSNSILDVKKYLHILQLSFSGLAGFVAAFFPFSMTIFCYLPQNLLMQLSVIFVKIFVLFLLDST